MARTKAANEAQYRYNEKKLKRIPLDVQKEYYDTVLKPAADAAGIGINTYIKQAISEKLQRDGMPADPGSVKNEQEQ